MLRFSKKVEYALIALVHMSRKKPGELTTSRELVDHYRVPPELMGKILQQLTRHGLIQSEQGVKGGYRLLESLERISISDIVKALDGPINIVSCLVQEDDCYCGQLEICGIKDTMALIQDKLKLFFDTITLDEIVKNRKSESEFYSN